ncbi:single-strand DNA-binding protein [Arthrobacter ginsengisoli]|uniref:Single-strand DNA-binding protein n=1 Tax=Arthrobacter ginsengisoli TaxID=1356565 RepID=A0ABU1U7K1_9MICC|nr:single-stranded DNA-binding protein [Arthrobacter ginsengisoli]MDR7081148.1 single-strand DNA-binding protein [Arthrobacter ginsengisoli]
MSDTITIRGFVATEPKSSTTPGGVATVSFRLGSTDRHYDRAANAWVEGTIDFFTVQGYRQLAGNIGCSVKKGQRVIVVGRIKLRSWETNGQIHHVVQIDADAVGHDLKWGSANYIRTSGNGPQAAAGPSTLHTSSPDADGRDGTHDDDGRERDEYDGADPAARTVFLNDENGDVEELDEETGELKGAAA